MVETDWREILSFSQRELAQADKEKLCENLSWMEADDIELNFTDLKTLFRLAQDILKYKSEQVNNLLGQLETAQRKFGKGKSKSSFVESPTKSTESVLDTIAHQEEVIKANKEILEQLYADISELQGRKSKLEEDRDAEDRESESSRDALSEINAVAQLEHEVTLKNRHIRKLLGDVKILEEENTKLKEKVAVFKDKLTEATELIENMTEQLYSINGENNRFKEALGKSEQAKAKLSLEIDSLKKDLAEKEYFQENISEEIKAKVLHWKGIAKAKKAEIEALFNENVKLKENLFRVSQSQPSSPAKDKKNEVTELKIRELQEKLIEASNEILESAKIIEALKAENNQLKSSFVEMPDVSVSDTRNESDEGKERTLISKLKRKVKQLTIALQGAEEMVVVREKELTEITSQLQLLKSDQGINALFQGFKNKKRKVKEMDSGIKNLVQEVNSLSQTVDDLQLENETLRQKLNIPMTEKVPTMGILKKFRDLEQNYAQLTKDCLKFENKCISLQLDNRNLHVTIRKIVKELSSMGCTTEKIEELCRTFDHDDEQVIENGGGDASTCLANRKLKNITKSENEEEMKVIIEENEGLRKGLKEVLDFIKDNSSTSSGVLALQCPSLEAVLHSMEARHAAGWFAPHMAAVMELKAALGGKDALLTALHEARKETFEVITRLSEETQKSRKLQDKLSEIESKNKATGSAGLDESDNLIVTQEFGTWVSDKEQSSIDFCDQSKIEEIVTKGNLIYENQLKNGLLYFHKKFKALFEKMTSIAVQTTDEQNKWSILEEKYKAEIENLKSQLTQNDDEDVSELSPGLVSTPNMSFLQRKCSYLEESYKYIRTLNENIKSEYLETKRDAMIATADYEIEIQKLILSVANLTDKLRSSTSLELFWKQNEALNELTIKYRKLLESVVNKKGESASLYKRLENNKMEIISTFRRTMQQGECKEEDRLKTIMSNIEQSIYSKQIQELCLELDTKNQHIESLELKITEFQESQRKIIDDNLSSTTREDVDLMKDQLEKLAEENKVLKEQCQHVEGQLDIALLQLQDSQQRQMSNDLEINMLRHQILDLQSIGDNKAIVARLSGEVLVAHLQASENHKKIERLNASLNKEKRLRIESEEMLKARQKIFDVYAFRYDAKFRYMYEVLQVLRQQYQGSLPLVSIENYLNNVEEISRKSCEIDEKLNEIEDLQSSLMTKHGLFDQILDVSKNKCLEDVDSCSHKLQNIFLKGAHSRELDHYNKKLKALEQSRQESLNRCTFLEKTLILTNHGIDKFLDNVVEKKSPADETHTLEVEDIHSDDDSDHRKSQTITLPKPQILKHSKTIDMTKLTKDDNVILMGSPIKASKDTHIPEVVNVFVQTISSETQKIGKIIQTDEDEVANKLQNYIQNLENYIENKNKELNEAMTLLNQQTEESNTEKINTQSKIQNLSEIIHRKEMENENLRSFINDLKRQIDDYKSLHQNERVRIQELSKADNQALADAVNQFEIDKKMIMTEYQQLLITEREEYSVSVRQLQNKVTELQNELDRRASDHSTISSEKLKEVIGKYTLKISELEDKCFKHQSELESSHTEIKTLQSEVDRWKDLATERLTKMEHLNSQLQERHSHEVESYKQENEHWMTQLNETQREHMELRTRLTEQKAAYVKQLSEKDAHIEQLRSVVHGLKTQIMSLSTMISVSDPGFDLSAIVEVEECSDALSQHGSERLELKYDSSIDLRDTQDELRMSTTSTNTWQEPLIERLRREKQMTAKQNAMLRRQIKALAARERRARLDAQNLKNQVFRISTSGNKVATAESAALHTKIASLQAQLMSARRETHSTVALWDKWKKAQQAAERWQARYEEKCQDVKRLEGSISLAKSAINRLEKEKRVLLHRLTDVKNDKVTEEEKQDNEPCEKKKEPSFDSESLPVSVSTRALLDRVEAQQRRIAALEVAEKGNEHLVSEYEKTLAEVTSLKGQVLKLESALLEAQIRTPMKSSEENTNELDYWKNYCDMLKEENVQLNMKVSSIETTPITAHKHRVNDLEQTVLTLRGLVSKLQAEQKSTTIAKRPDSRPSSRPSSGRSVPDKNKTQLESYRIEIANLKRSIQDKDLLLERSKEMLKIAAEREDDLLRENTFLRRQLNELTINRHGFLSA